LNKDGKTDLVILATRHYARKTKEIGDIFVKIFGTTSRNTRIRPVYCYQSEQPDATLGVGLDFLEDEYTKVANCIWGISPKTGVDEGVLADNVVLTQLEMIEKLKQNLRRIIGGYQGTTSTPVIEQAAAFAAWHGVSYAAYEGGIGFVNGKNIRPNDAFEMMTTNWEIQNICSNYLQSWFSYGNDNLLCWFIAGASDWKGQNFGHQSDIHGLTWNVQEQNTLPIQALDQAIGRGSYEITAGLSVPGQVDTRRHSVRSAKWESTLRNEVNWQSNKALYLLNALSAKQYSFILVSERHLIEDTNTEIWVNNLKIATVIIPKGTGSHSSTLFRTTLRKGMNALKMVYSANSMGNYYLIVR
jgi:hypothetical protein